jgi:YihY family inner membrane protein
MKKYTLIAPRIAHHVAELWQQGIHRASRFDKQTHGWLGVLAGAVQAVLNPNSGITAAAFASSMIANLRPWLPEQIIVLKGGISLALAIVLDVGAFMTLYMLLPHGAATWREILAGAIGAGLLWEIAKKAFLFFVSTYISVSNLVYGSVAAIVAFLTWAYLSSLIFLFGAYLSAAYYRLKQQQREAAVISNGSPLQA